MVSIINSTYFLGLFEARPRKPKTDAEAADFPDFLASEPNFCDRNKLATCLRNIAAAIRSVGLAAS
jgi:hypothetical protein